MPAESVADFEKSLLTLLHAKYQQTVLDNIKAGKLTDEVTAAIEEAARDVAGKYTNN